MISGLSNYKKRNCLIFLSLFLFSIKIYSLDNTKVRQLIKENRETDYYHISNIYFITNDYSIALIKYEDVDAYKIYIFSNTGFKTVDIDCSSNKTWLCLHNLMK